MTLQYKTPHTLVTATYRVDFSVEVEMTDAEGATVATATVDWNVKLKDPES